jgi:hypothetical protein
MRVSLILALMLWLCLNSQAQIEDEVIEDEAIENNAVLKNNKKNNKKKGLNRLKAADNIFVGMNFSFSFSTLFFMDISPYGGYLFGKYVGVGLGGTYIYFANLNSPGINDNIYGGRLFVNLRPFPDMKGLKGVYAHLEGEYLNHTYAFSGVNPLREFVPAVNVGLGFNTAFDKGFAFTTELLINALWFSRQNNPGLRNIYNIPWQYRIGIYYAFLFLQKY